MVGDMRDPPQNQSATWAIPAFLISLSGLGLSLMLDSLDHFWPHAPYWVWAAIFLSGVGMMLALPIWAAWQFLPRLWPIFSAPGNRLFPWMGVGGSLVSLWWLSSQHNLLAFGVVLAIIAVACFGLSISAATGLVNISVGRVSRERGVKDAPQGDKVTATAVIVDGPSGRQSFVEFAKQAVPGLSLSGGETPPFLLWDLCLAVRQSAADGDLNLDGKRVVFGYNNEYLFTRPFVRIPTPELASLEIVCDAWTAISGKNEEVRATAMGLDHEYRDLHISDARVGAKWLKYTWPSRQGVSHAKYKESMARRAKRDEQEHS